jgi:probable phosphoglycerate mutase
MKLYIVRHGETEENVAHTLMGQLQGVLTDNGKEQAGETALILKGHTINHIYSSDLARCVDTAEYIKKFHPDTPVTFIPELRERHFGVLQGRVASEVNWDEVPGEGDDKKPEGGESLVELRARALGFIDQIYKLHPNDTVLLVSHNGWIKQVIAHFSGVHSGEVEKVKNAEVIEIDVEEGLKGKVVK